MRGLSFFLRFSTNLPETARESFSACFSGLVAFSAVSGHFKGVFRIFENLLPKTKKNQPTAIICLLLSRFSLNLHETVREAYLVCFFSFFDIFRHFGSF